MSINGNNENKNLPNAIGKLIDIWNSEKHNLFTFWLSNIYKIALPIKFKIKKEA